ncbi:protein unc-93 homolog A isoform X1 [Hydra vulgaris]|uniref:protein unc-93 homolog A isoform X1 n=1 Tax=Hydra vulgaris TaxID=6087 RepID=UPI00019245CE|nr:protein unc-93 homolog A [Hydra vulgaris]
MNKLEDDTDRNNPKKSLSLRSKTYKNLLVISLGFLFLFTAFQALQNLQSSIHNDKNLGFVSLIAIYASLLTSCMFVPPIVIGKLGCKYTVVLSMFGYVSYTLSMFYPRFWTVVPASILLGFSGAPLWSAKCSYLTSSGIRYGKAINVSEDTVVTNFFGIFFLIFQSGQIWGNLISSLVLKPSGGKFNSTGTNIGEICGKNFCPHTSIISHQETTKSTVTTLMSIYLGFGILAIAFVLIFLDKIKVVREEKKRGVCDLFIATLKHLKNTKMQLLIPLTIFSGLEQGFVFGDFTKAFITCALGIEKVGLIMICFGAVDAIFSLVLSKIVEKTGRPVVMILAALINFGLLTTFLIWEPTENTIYIYYIGAGLWGFADAVWQTQVNAFYGLLFPTNQEAAFSNYRLWESLGFVVAFSYGNVFCTNVKLYILIATMILGVTFYGVIEWIRNGEIKKKNDYHLNEMMSS